MYKHGERNRKNMISLNEYERFSLMLVCSYFLFEKRGSVYLSRKLPSPP